MRFPCIFVCGYLDYLGNALVHGALPATTDRILILARIVLVVLCARLEVFWVVAARMDLLWNTRELAPRISTAKYIFVVPINTSY